MDMNEIQSEIQRLEDADTNYTNCGKLATLYTVRNGLRPEEPHIDNYSYSYANAPIQSEFINICMAAGFETVLGVLDEHMECIKALYPKEYNSIIRKLKK